MALGTLNSFILSSFLSVMVFSGMQVFKAQLASSEWFTILGGFIGSILFIFLLTAFNNLETLLFGDNFQAKFFPEVLACVVMAMLASGMVHRVCITTCFIFSAIALYYMNRISATKYQAPATPSTLRTKSKKKKQN